RAEPAHHGRDVVPAEVDAAAGTADALEAGNDLLATWAVLKEDTDLRRRRGVVRIHFLEALDVAFLLEDLGDVRLEPRGRHVHAGVPRVHGIANARDHVCDRISHSSSYQLLLMTPAISPRRASSRKQRRQSANLRR